jgi:cytochrome b involved in lipid metabolism
MSESFTTKQVAEHASVEKGLYIIVDNGVYKLDSFVDEHPGGAKILKRVGGKDASKQFWKVRTQTTSPFTQERVGFSFESERG